MLDSANIGREFYPQAVEKMITIVNHPFAPEKAKLVSLECLSIWSKFEVRFRDGCSKEESKSYLYKFLEKLREMPFEERMWISCGDDDIWLNMAE